MDDGLKLDFLLANEEMQGLTENKVDRIKGEEDSEK
jgi:hypothetical protein